MWRGTSGRRPFFKGGCAVTGIGIVVAIELCVDLDTVEVDDFVDLDDAVEVEDGVSDSVDSEDACFLCRLGLAGGWA